MEDYKKFEAAVIRRACYMVNTLAINEDEFTRSFYFTNTLPFNKWYEKNACDSWILTSFYKAYRIFMEKKASAEGERKRLERDVLIPACAAINEVIDSQNEKTAYYYSEDFLIENVMESLAQQGYTYDYVQKRAREMAKDADFRRKFYDNIKEKINIPFEHQLGNPNAGSPLKFDASSLWQPIEKKYRHVTPRDIEYTSNTNQWTTTEDSLGLAGIDMKNFAEYQYVRALEDILHECFTNDDKVNALVEDGYSLRPELNDKCFPGAKWDILQTVWKDEPELEKDLV